MVLTNSKYKLINLLLFLFLLSPIYAISPTGEVTEIGQTDKLGEKIFPVSFFVTYDVYDFDFIKDYPTNMEFDINGGYGTRSIFQDPITGLAKWCENYDSSDNSTYFSSPNKKYGIIFSGWEMRFNQKLPISEKIPGTLSSWIGTGAHYEQAVDLLENFRNSDPSDSTIFNQLAKDSDKTFYGIPDLNGNRYIHDFSITLGSIYKHKINDISINSKLSLKLTPEWLLNNLEEFGGHSNYNLAHFELNLSKAYFKKYYNDLFTNKKYRLFNLTLKNEFDYRYINGSAVPMYEADYFSINHSYNNLQNNIYNKLSLVLYGPQFMAKDCYPFIQFYYYSDYRWGKLNNTDPLYNEYNNGVFYHELGCLSELRFIGIIHLDYKIKYNLISNKLKKEAYFYVQV